MRTRQKEAQRSQYKYNGLTPREFGERIGLSEDAVRGMIADGWFRWTEGRPECLDVRKVGGQRPEYRILPSAVDRYFEERAVCGPVHG